MKIVFFGTPDYVLPILKALHKAYVAGPGISPIAAVVTQSPKPIGRKQILAYSPVDKWAHAHKVPIYYSASDLAKNPPDADIGILASYGEIIKKNVIDLFPQGILVIHPSLLPKYRGASPIPAAIMNADAFTGCSIIKMDKKMDHGPVISQFKEEILEDDNSETLRNRIFEKSAEVLIEMLPAYIHGKIKLKAQDEEKATYTKLMKREDGFIDLTKKGQDPSFVVNFIRAMSPWPGAYTNVKIKDQAVKRLKLIKAHLESGEVVFDEVQLEGKNPVSWEQFKNGYKEAVFT